MVDCNERIRLVILGGPNVGKSSVIKRFLFNTFPEKHKPTVEDLYSHEFEIGSPSGVPLKVDILDTAGDFQFPAMRRLSIANGSAFLLVYAIDSQVSFEQVKGCFEEIREQRADFQEVPIIIAGNKADIGLNRREVELDEVSDWIHDHLPKFRGKAMECSSKENRNVREIFKSFLQLSKIPYRSTEEGGGLLKTSGPGGIGLRRRSSAYAGSKNRNVTAAFLSSSSNDSHNHPSTTPPSSSSSSAAAGAGTPPQRSRFGMLNARLDGSSSGETNRDDNNDQGFFGFGGGGGGGGGGSSGNGGGGLCRNQPRSRSLIRRCSRKAKQTLRDVSSSGGATGGGGEQVNDCRVS